MASQISILVMLGALASTTSGRESRFLGQRKMSKTVVQAELNGILHEVLGQGHGMADARLTKIHKTLDPLFRSLPKNKQGHISVPVMRYAVRRYFSQNRGWVVKGFNPYEEHVNASSLGTEILQNKLPGFIRSILEDRFAVQGFSLDAVVAMIASLEALVFDEVIRGVELAFYLNSFELTQALSQDDLTSILSSFLIVEMLEGSANKTKHALNRKKIHKRYPFWSTTILFLQDTVTSDIYKRQSSTNPFKDPTYSFEDVVRITQEVAEAFGSWSNYECHEMKDMLMEMDVHGTGRVKMSDFYRYSKNGNWQFLEPSEQLRMGGALDESSRWIGPQVMIPNYINSMSNCITSAEYYSICCLNECDQVLLHLESRLAAPRATASEIITALQSAMVGAPSLSAFNSDRLADITRKSGELIPIHGRLFARWLHFVYPQECPYPHEPGVVKPMTQKQWKDLVGAKNEDASVQEIAQHLESEFARRAPSTKAGAEMWNLGEDLLDSSTPSDAMSSSISIWSSFSMLAQLGMLAGFLALLWPLLQVLCRGGKRKSVEYDV